MRYITRRSLGPIPLVRLTFLFLAGVALLFIITGSIFFANIFQLEERFAVNNEKLAQQEIADALQMLKTHVMDTSQKLATWDETIQQIENPSDYAYWRNSRVLSSGILPPTTDAVELYDVHGKTLSKEPRSGEAAMPPSIQQSDLRPALTLELGHEHLILFFPVYQDSAQQIRIGYGGLKFDFKAELATLRRFLYVDMASVQITAKDGLAIALDQSQQFLTFKTRPSAEIEAFKALIYRVMYQIIGIVAIATLLTYFFVVLLLGKPLRRLSDHIDAMRAGRVGLLSESYRGLVPVAELENVRNSLNDYQDKLSEMHVDLAHKNKALWELAHHDPLTGIFNRRAFEDDWNALNHPATTPINLAFLLFDCDHFKAINDTYGHQVGDQVLQAISTCLLDALRAGDRLYRMGGDEFATILHETDAEVAKRVADRCVQVVSKYDFSAYGINEPVGISIGIAHSQETTSAEMLHKQADIAMYHAKRPGGAKVAVYAENLAHAGQAVLSSAETAAVYAAIADPMLLEMHYQKIVQLPIAEVEYFEALVRIRLPDRLLNPGNIFPVVETKRLEIEFDQAVLARISVDLASGKLPEGTGISLNISGMSIISAQIVDKLLTLRKFLERYKIVIEITETALITQIGHASVNLQILRKAGFVIALDDFGSGYSSFRYLSTMPVDIIKFDISMVQCLEGEDRQRVIVENLAKLISAAGFKLVAEGIETLETLQRVANLGFTHAQGYYLGRPEALKR